METPGSIIDKLITVDLKMWNNQEVLYEIRRMSYEEFCKRFNLPVGLTCERKNSSFELYSILKKACDLNVQRNDLINELDEKVIDAISELMPTLTSCGMSVPSKEEITAQLKSKFSFKQNKTY